MESGRDLCRSILGDVGDGTAEGPREEEVGGAVLGEESQGERRVGERKTGELDRTKGSGSVGRIGLGVRV